MIIDAHAHMFTTGTFKEMIGNAPERMLKARKIPEKMMEGLKHDVKDNTAAWLEAMDRLGIEKTVFMATSPQSEEFAKFINSSNRFVGFAKINPTLPDAVDTLKAELKAGMTGVKLYATSGRFDIGAQEAWPFYELCEKERIPITIHFGVTIELASNLNAGNPLNISRVITEFPELKVAIAHFGAGFFRETLMLKYKRDNLFIETSGTNNWLPYQDNFLTLRDVFRKSLTVFGPQGIIFGTDTTIFPDGYREHILKQQTDILNELKVPKSDIEDIIYNNAKRAFGI
jgi:predicted TIM-barrel fold metal-dependent hydrolase